MSENEGNGKAAELIGEFCEALDDEIEAVKKHGGTRVYARRGEFVDQVGPKYLYVFELDNQVNVPDDSSIQAVIGAELYAATVVASVGFRITIAFDRDVGKSVPLAELNVAPWFLLDLLKKRLQDVGSGEIKANSHLAVKLLGLEATRTGIVSDLHLCKSGKAPPPNAEQLGAVRQSIGSEVCFLWGPPGTGKTKTLARIVEEMVRRDETVLVLANTNVAVDQAAGSLASLFDGEDFFEAGEIVRYGEACLPEVIGNENLCFGKIVERKGHDIKAKIDTLVAQETRLDSELAQAQSVLATHDSLKEEAAQIDRLEEELRKNTNEQSSAADEKERIDRKILADQEKLRIASSFGQIRRLISGINISRLEQTISNQKQESIGYKRAADRLAEKIQSLTDDIKYAQEAVREKRDSLTSLGDPWRSRGATAARETELQQQRDQVEEEIAGLREQLAAIETEALKKARVVATTLTKAYTGEPPVHSREFDNVVIDESSMAPIPTLYFGASLGRSRAVAVGDFRQLAPIKQADTVLADKWLGRDVFELNRIVETVDRGRSDSRLAKLTTQYRMHPSISSLANELVYRGLLKDGPKVKAETDDIRKRAPGAGSSLLLFDTSEINPWCSRHAPGFSRFNIYSAVVAVELARAWPGDLAQIGIITPYRDQATLIRRILSDVGLDVDVSTVHRFQGMERDFIIFDAVDGPGMRTVGALLRGRFGSDAMRVINVAVTRAKGKLAVIANLGYLSSRLPKQSVLGDLLGHLEKEGEIVDSRWIVSSYFHNEVERADMLAKGVKLDLPPKGTRGFTEANFYPAFEADVRSARKQVVILSPFVTRRRIDTLVVPLRALVDSGVRVDVITRGWGSQGTAMDNQDECIDYLKGTGVNVITNRNMHEKVAIIDKKVLWHGSLNILSHRNSTESMLRVESPAMVAETGHLLGIEQLLGLEVHRQERNQLAEDLRKALPKAAITGCPVCGEPMVIRFSQYGPFLACQHREHNSTNSIASGVLKQAISRLRMKCPECGAALELKYSPKNRSQFLGCSRYPDCKFAKGFK